MFSQYGKLRPISDWDQFTSLGHPSKFPWVLGLGFITAPTSLNRGQPNFARCLAISWACALYIHFQGLLPHWRNIHRCKIHFASESCVLLYWQRHWMALEQWVSAKLCGIQHRATPIFGMAAITLGISPHSSFISSSITLHTFNKSTASITLAASPPLHTVVNNEEHRNRRSCIIR